MDDQTLLHIVVNFINVTYVQKGEAVVQSGQKGLPTWGARFEFRHDHLKIVVSKRSTGTLNLSVKKFRILSVIW